MNSITGNLIHIGPLAFLAALGVAIMIERFIALYVIYPLKNNDQFFEGIQSRVMEDRVSEALTMCDRRKSCPSAKVVRDGLMRIHQPEDIIENGLGMAVSEGQERIQQRTGYLATIANVATLAGLFGTVLGLVQSFEAIGGASAQQRSALLAAGISTAMNATLMGLGIAIPCLLVYAAYANRTNRLNREVELSAAKTLDIIKLRFYSNDKTPGKAA